MWATNYSRHMLAHDKYFNVPKIYFQVSRICKYICCYFPDWCSKWSYFYTEYHYVLLIALWSLYLLYCQGWQFHLALFSIKIDGLSQYKCDRLETDTEYHRYDFLRLLQLHCLRFRKVCFSDFSFYVKLLINWEKCHS